MRNTPPRPPDLTIGEAGRRQERATTVVLVPLLVAAVERVKTTDGRSASSKDVSVVV